MAGSSVNIAFNKIQVEFDAEIGKPFLSEYLNLRIIGYLDI